MLESHNAQSITNEFNLQRYSVAMDYKWCWIQSLLFLS